VSDELFAAMHHQKIQWQIKARRLERQIAAVRELHFRPKNRNYCAACQKYGWPCETIRVLGEKE